MSGQSNQQFSGLGYTSTSYKDKMKQMSDQERMIEEKKRKILEKFKTESTKTTTTPAATAKPVGMPMYV